MWYLIGFIIIELLFIVSFSLLVNKNDDYQQYLEDKEQLKYIKYFNNKKAITFKKGDS